MYKLFVALIALGVGGTAAEGWAAEATGFDQDAVGQAPAQWTCGATGRGTPQWTVAADPTAPSHPNVLRQSGNASFPWCVLKGSAAQDGSVQVRFKAVSGKQDQAGGLVWRWKDSDNYYVARANALENNVSLYYTERGTRKTLKYVNAPVALGQWHTLRVDFRGPRIQVAINGNVVIDMEDRRIEGPGQLGVWTKADSVTTFDDFSYERAQ